MRIQHLLDAVEVQLPTSLSSLLLGVVNLLAVWKAPQEVALYLAGGRLTALKMDSQGKPMDVIPIAVGETLRRLVSKCLCTLTKMKAAAYFEPFQCGVSCPSGSERIVHSLRQCIEDHWKDKDFITCMLDLRNAFNIVSRQAILEECANHFPELLPWVSWCYGQHPYLWHQSDIQTGSATG